MPPSSDNQFVIRQQGAPERCEICHQADQFDPATGVCRRCQIVSGGISPLAYDYGISGFQSGEIPERFQSVLKAELKPDEQLLWVGKPSSLPFGSPWATAFGISAIIEGAVLCPVLLWQEYLQLNQLVYLVFMIFALTAGLAVVCFFSTRKNNPLCFITSKRVIAVEINSGVPLTFSYKVQKPIMMRERKSDGSGDLFLFVQTGGPNVDQIGFYGVRQVRQVATFIRDHLQTVSK